MQTNCLHPFLLSSITEASFSLLPGTNWASFFCVFNAFLYAVLRFCVLVCLSSLRAFAAEQQLTKICEACRLSQFLFSCCSVHQPPAAFALETGCLNAACCCSWDGPPTNIHKQAASEANDLALFDSAAGASLGLVFGVRERPNSMFNTAWQPFKVRQPVCFLSWLFWKEYCLSEVENR